MSLTGPFAVDVPLEDRQFQTYSGDAGGWIGWWEPIPQDSHIAFLYRDGTITWAEMPESRKASTAPTPPSPLDGTCESEDMRIARRAIARYTIN